jgi:hypothetical protein
MGCLLLAHIARQLLCMQRVIWSLCMSYTANLVVLHRLGAVMYIWILLYEIE